MRIIKIENVRDLLAAGMAEDLVRFIRDRSGGQLIISPALAEEIVTHLLSHITPKSFELLAELQAKQPTSPHQKQHPPSQERTTTSCEQPPSSDLSHPEGASE